MSICLNGFREIWELPTGPAVLRRQSGVLELPQEAFPGQDLMPLVSGLNHASIRRDAHDALITPAVDLNLFTIENGLFFLDYGLDGTIVTAGGHAVHQTAVFRKKHRTSSLNDIIFNDVPVELGDVFIGFDGAWRNYFHWLCFCLPKSYLAANLLGPSTIIAVPEYKTCLKGGIASYSETSYNQSLQFSGLADRVTQLSPGIYRAKQLNFFWTVPKEPTDILYLKDYYAVFDRMVDSVGPEDTEFRNINLVRSSHVASRIESVAAKIVASTVERRGFKSVTFEGIDMRQQISIFAHAERIISPHGAGLANCVFNSGGLKVLELNKDIDDHGSFRPWFFLLSRLRGHHYVTLDTTAAKFSAEQIESALQVLDGNGNPTATLKKAGERQ